MEGPQFWILRLGELTLKSRPVRKHFQNSMEQGMLELAINAGIDLHIEHKGALAIASSHSPTEAVEDVFCHCFGLQSVERSIMCPAEPAEVAKVALSIDEDKGTPRTFGVATKRSGVKGDWGSQDFSGMIGHHMLEGDESLSVNLGNPDYPVRVILTKNEAWLLQQKVNCPSGLPIGVQGLVKARIDSRDICLSAWQLMRRGCRIVAVEGSLEEYLEQLAKWDSTISSPQLALRSKSGPGRNRGIIWGRIGNEIEVQLPEGAKNTPFSTLDPMCAWSESEKEQLFAHICNPTSCARPSYDNDMLTAWIA